MQENKTNCSKVSALECIRTHDKNEFIEAINFRKNNIEFIEKKGDKWYLKRASSFIRAYAKDIVFIRDVLSGLKQYQMRIPAGSNPSLVYDITDIIEGADNASDS